MGPKIHIRRVRRVGSYIRLGRCCPSQSGNRHICRILRDKMKSFGKTLEERRWIRQWCKYEIHNPGNRRYVADEIGDGDRFCDGDCLDYDIEPWRIERLAAAAIRWVSSDCTAWAQTVKAVCIHHSVCTVKAQMLGLDFDYSVGSDSDYVHFWLRLLLQSGIRLYSMSSDCTAWAQTIQCGLRLLQSSLSSDVMVQIWKIMVGMVPNIISYLRTIST